MRPRNEMKHINETLQCRPKTLSKHDPQTHRLQSPSHQCQRNKRHQKFDTEEWQANARAERHWIEKWRKEHKVKRPKSRYHAISQKNFWKNSIELVFCRNRRIRKHNLIQLPRQMNDGPRIWSIPVIQLIVCHRPRGNITKKSVLNWEEIRHWTIGREEKASAGGLKEKKT